MAQSVAFAVQNVELLAAGLASDSAARSEARRRLQSRREHAYALDAAETLALAMEDAEEYEPSAVLLQDDQVAEPFCAACLDQLLHSVATAIHPFRVGQEQLDLLQELRELAAGVVRGCYEYPRVRNARVRVLRVDAFGWCSTASIVEL